MNDPTEVLLFYNFVKGIIDEHIQKSKNKFFWPWFLIKHSSLLENYLIYICSFSEMPDYLPLWRWYGNNGAGYSFGFKSNFQNSKELHTLKPVTVKISYDKNKLFQSLEFIIAKADEWVSSYSSNHKILQELGPSLASHLLALAPGFKHEGYEHEKEHRFYLSELITSDGTKYPKPIPENLKHERKKEKHNTEPPCILHPCNEKIPFLKIPFSKEDLSEIWVGPRLNFECAKDKVEETLQIAGYDIKRIEIKPSEMPYRA